MDPKDLKKYLAGLGIAGLLSGTSLMAAEAPKAGDTTKSTPTSTATKTTPDKKEPAKSG